MSISRERVSKHPLYTTWVKMRNRCNNVNNDNYDNYGGRGIKVCSRWDDFQTFAHDMGERPKGFTLDRVDVNGDYTPDNCRWANQTQQLRNTRRNVDNRIGHSELQSVIDLHSQQVPMKEIARRLSIHESFVSGLVLGYKLASPIPRSYGLNEVSLIPQKNVCRSRLDADISSEVVRGVYLQVPMIAANMSSVCNASFCIDLDTAGALGILHRAAPEQVLKEETLIIANRCKNVAVSLGVEEMDRQLAASLVNCGANILTIDIANGYSDTALSMVKYLRKEFPQAKIIVGNTTNVGMLYEFADYVDALKVGIAQGFACETANTAAHTEKQFSAVWKFKEISRKLGIPIISDGGVREPADLVKAIAAGANSAMAGMIFARCPESAAEIICDGEGRVKKVYAGMASRYVQDKWKGGLKAGTCPEGKTTLIEIGESISNLIERYSGALRSGITYGGGINIPSFQDKAEFIRLV